MSEKLKDDETVIALAAAVCGRATELITDGWTKGSMRNGAGGAENFCIHGAVELALDEVFGTDRKTIRQDVNEVAVAFICDEAFGKMQNHSGGIPAAAFNDAAQRKHEEVVGVMNRAHVRLWDLTVERDSIGQDGNWTPSKWAEVDTQSEEAQAFLHASLN